jgi:uncharacterized membrane protein/thiol-disulfide isomerase/thioredoxin
MMKTPLQQLSQTSIKSFFLLLFTIISATFFWRPGQASNQVVRALLFYSPSCGHCEKVITEVIPPIQEKFGDALTILGVDVTFAEGQDLYRAAVDYYQIPQDRLGVPTMIIGDSILVGSQEIPEMFELLVEQGMQNGGIDWPSIPGLEGIIPAIEQDEPAPVGGSSDQSGQLSSTLNQVEAQTQNPEQDSPPQPLWMQKFMLDPLANSVAVVLLVIMIVGVIASVSFVLKPLPAEGSPERYPWLIPLLVCVGIFIAVYMTYVEVTKNEAICGPVGDCNAVQQSSYATLFGFLPVGIFGLIGYLAIGVAWWLQRVAPPRLRNLTRLAMWGMALFGVIFSIYLTFLEPFVIGATCIWCISSAIVISLLLAVTTNFARPLEDPEEDELYPATEEDR